MEVVVYCFLPGIRFDPLPEPFKIKDGVAWISNDHEPNRGQEKQEVIGCSLSYQASAKTKDFLRVAEAPGDKRHTKNFKKIGELLDKYREELSEVAIVVEGLISVSTAKPMPAFLLDHINVRLIPETERDKKLIAEEKVLHTFGDVGKNRNAVVKVVRKADSMLDCISKAEPRISALSIYTLASRAEERFELEIAYLNFFRIIEGYFGDGTPNIDYALKAKTKEIIRLLKPDADFVQGLKSILSRLKLSSKANLPTDEEEIVSDLVLLRHKLAHYNLSQQDRHFYSSLRIDLKSIIRYIHHVAFLLIRKDIDDK